MSDGKRGYDSSRDSTSIEIAWLELNESFFNEYKKFQTRIQIHWDEDSKSKGLANFILPTENDGIAPYSHWAYLARERILKWNQSFNSFYRRWWDKTSILCCYFWCYSSDLRARNSKEVDSTKEHCIKTIFYKDE